MKTLQLGGEINKKGCWLFTVFAVRTRKDVALCACKTQKRRQKFGFPNMTPLPLHDSRPPYAFCLFLRRPPLTSPFCKTTAANYFRHATTSSHIKCHSNTFPLALLLPPQLSPSHAAILPPLLSRRYKPRRRCRALQLFIESAYSATSQSLGRRIIGAR